MASTSHARLVEVPNACSPARCHSRRPAKASTPRGSDPVGAVRAGGALAAVVPNDSALPICVAGAALVATLAGLTAWVLITDRWVRNATRNAPWSRDEWRELEQSFWAYVNRGSQATPHPSSDSDEQRRTNPTASRRRAWAIPQLTAQRSLPERPVATILIGDEARLNCLERLMASTAFWRNAGGS
jgi:hypothetical protein